ncbi:MAG: M48 family metallopeptidase [Caldisericia bacterium]
MVFKVSKIVRSKRKSFCIEIGEFGEIILRVPNKARNFEINNFLKKHSNWIYKKLRIVEKRKENLKPKNFEDGETFLFLGQSFELKIVENQKESLIFKDKFYLSKKYLDKAKDAFIKFYKNRAKEVISQRVDYYSKMNSFKFNKIKINSATKRWGSCTSKGNLNFSYRLIMAPIEIIDYVVIHELVHLVDKTHSKSFYEKISKILPEYKKSIEWLNKYHYLLKI